MPVLLREQLWRQFFFFETPLSHHYSPAYSSEVTLLFEGICSGWRPGGRSIARAAESCDLAMEEDDDAVTTQHPRERI